MPNSSKKQINLQNLKLGYVSAFDPKTQKPVGKAKLVSPKETRKFLIKLKKISDKYPGTTPEDFLSVMIKENSLDKDGVLLLDQKSQLKTNSKNGRARGLIQFVPKTAKRLGLNQDDLATMTPSDQLDYVDKYFKGAKKGSLKNYSDLYMFTFQPAAVGEDDSYIIGKKNSTDKGLAQRYKSNSALDKDNSGTITKGEFQSWSQKNMPSETNKDLFSSVDTKAYENYYNEVANPVDPKLKEVVLGEDQYGKYVSVLTDMGTGMKPQYTNRYIDDTDKGLLQPITDNETVEIKKVGDVDYVQISSIDENNNVQRRYIDIDEDSDYDPSAERGYKAEPIEAKEMYLKEIKKQDLSEKGLAKAQDITESSLADYGKDTDEYKEINFNFQKDHKIPFIKKDIEQAKEYAQKELLKISNTIANSPPSNKSMYEPYLKKAQENLEIATTQEKKTNELFQRYNDKANIYKQTKKSNKYSKQFNEFSTTERKQILEGAGDEDLDKINKLGEQLTSNYKTSLESEIYKKFKPKPFVIKDKYGRLLPNAGNNWLSDGSSNGSTTTTTTTTNGSGGNGNVDVSDDGYEESTIGANQESPVDENGNPINYTSEYYDEQIAEIDEILNEKQNPEFEPDFSGLKKDDKLGNFAGNAMDIGRGLLGAKGMLEETPTYEETDIFKEYTQDAIRRKDIGLTPIEIANRKQDAERAFAFSNKNLIRAANGSAGTYLGNQNALNKGLQDRYAKISEEDQVIKRNNLSRFDSAAVNNENVNARKFNAKFETVMQNKKAGAKLVRDSIKNMNERAAFEEQYGEGSMNYEYQKELLASKQEMAFTLKEARKYQKEKRTKELEKQKKDYLLKKKNLNKK